MKRVIVFFAFVAASLAAAAQTDWNKIEKLIEEDDSYKSAYEQAEKVFKKTKSSPELLTAAWYMMRAEEEYQEEAFERAQARFRSILPRLEAPERAVCYALLGVKDSALMDAEQLKKIPAERVKRFCMETESDKGVLMTPTVYDVVAWTVIMVSPEEAEELLQKLVDFHQNDSDDIRIMLDLALIQLKHSSGKPEEVYLYYINKYRASTCMRKTQFYSAMASALVAQNRHEEALRYCDTAIALAPKSTGGTDARNLRTSITRTEIDFERWQSNNEAIPGKPSLHVLNYRNLRHVYLGVAPYVDEETARDEDPKMVHRWELDVDTSDKYHSVNLLFDVPALEPGRWMLVASPDEKFDKNDAKLKVVCTDVRIMRMNDNVFQLVNAVNGDPIVGHEVSFFKYQKTSDKQEYEKIYSDYTDADGRVRYKGDENHVWIQVVRDGYTFFEDYWCYGAEKHSEMERGLMLVDDRPVYRPGDTVHVAAVLYENDGREGRTLGGEEICFAFLDPNWEVQDSLRATTDDFGMAEATFILPRNCMDGGWGVSVNACTEGLDYGDNNFLYINVEEYKQPKFMVSLDRPQPPMEKGDNVLAFGKPYTVYGLAQAYSGANVGGAKVKYTVNRYARFWHGSYYGKVKDIELLKDSTVTASDGSFAISFTPQPDSLIDPSQKPYFRYEILVEVTDLNGETHNARTTVVVGYTNTKLQLTGIAKNDLSSLESVSFTLTDINDRPLEGDVKVTVSRLKLPEARLVPPQMILAGKVYNSISRERYAELFPSYAYSVEEYSRSNTLPVEWTWSVTEHTTAAELQHKVQLPELKSGYYMVVVVSGDDADTQYVTLTLPKERRVQSRKLVWTDLSSTMAYPGDRVTLRYASAFEGVRFFYVLAGPDGSEIDTRWLPAGRGIKSLSIPVDSAMLGGFTVNLFAMKDGVEQHCKLTVDVPFTHKQLNVDIATFRDKLQPGEQEEWTLTVENARNKEKRTAALIMTMYDEALSNYGIGGLYMSYPWRHGGSYWFNWLSERGYNASYYDKKARTARGSDPKVSFWIVNIERILDLVVDTDYELVEDYAVEATGTARGESGMVTMQGGVRKNKTVVALNEVVALEDEEVVSIGAPEYGMRLTQEDIAHMPGNDDVVATVGGLGYSDGRRQEPVQVRSNLGTLAFFAADIRTDANGTATYRFRVPELLTSWHMEGVAVTPALEIGTLGRTLVTQKPLMVQPNIPRFLRHGDSLVLMAKVMNLTDSERQARVNFSLKNAADDNLFILGEKVVVVPAQGSAQVTFPINDLPSNLYVATYEITAQTCDEMAHSDLAHYSDGERGQIPVVSSRQAVTLSQPLYINGKGEKTFRFPLSAFRSSTTAEPHFLAAELTTDPMWLAIKAMPYLKEQENPSNLYLANSLYVNTLAKGILENIKGFAGVVGDLLTDTANTRLKINEDIKQTLLEATPWLRDAEGEVEQRQAIANYFDSTALNSQLSTLNSQLLERQNNDGGWSWMPESESSLWVTEQILKRLAPVQFAETSLQLALSYVDKEEQHHYEKYIKPYIKKYNWQPDNIEYLYTRSLYGKAKTEAYKFYYNNALKHYKSYSGLYSQAQLALIFQRHGDKKVARDLIRRIKEKSLVNDEMGMYWRDNRSGWCWYERPIETQALLIQAFREVTPKDTVSVALMQQWILKQKQTTRWESDRATVDAIAALMPTHTLTNAITQSRDHAITLTLFGTPMTAPSQGLEGYRSQRWTGAALDTLTQAIEQTGNQTITLKKETSGIAWGAVYFQYTDDMDKIPSTASGITLKRTYLHDGPWKVGDRVKVRIEISCDRTMEYLELIDGRPSCVEPLSTRSGWHWSSGLRYYVEVKNTATHCYINRLEKGKYVVEYEVYVTNPGTFLAAPVTMQCMYAPEFRATAPAERISVD